MNVYNLLKRIKSDKGSAFISKEYKEFCKSQYINCEFGTANLHTGTGLVERTIQSMKSLILAILEDGTNLRESANRALQVQTFTVHSKTKKKPFEIHFERGQRTKLSNIKKFRFSGLKRLFSLLHPIFGARNNGPHSHVQKEDGGPEIQTRDDVPANQKPTGLVRLSKFEYPFKFYEENCKKKGHR